MFTEKDLEQIKSKGIELKDVEQQIENFQKGFPFIKLAAAATPGNGLHSFDDSKVEELKKAFDENYKDYDLLKFVPASGAASRMFKHLLEFMAKYDGSEEAIEKMNKDKGFNSVWYFFEHIKNFAFYEDLKTSLLEEKHNIDELLKQKDYKTILEYFLTDKGLNYALKPKGLLQFHNYEDGPRLAVEEHLVEAAHYSTDIDNIANLHLTVSPDHENDFKKQVELKKGKYADQLGVTYKIEYSNQMPQTDMIAVDMNNKAFRTDDGKLLFRPGGHGALIENLNQLDTEIVFIKNIDNIVPDRLRETTYTYKKVIGGLLFELQDKTFEYLEMLDDGNVDEKTLEEIKDFARDDLSIFIPIAFEGYDTMDKIDFLFQKLNRPMRVCGMVKNEGEPGGGPFWVEDENEQLSLQIVESSQMDLNDTEQKKIVASATHFNPVDLVCGIRDFRDNKFNLSDFVDPNTGFISIKSMGGRELKAQELPGLWNGAMADWITVFVETPIITFNPVKTVNDLLREQHQPA